MTTRSPPRLATWLLAELGSGRRLEELLGDLSEQFAAGRSRPWYWRQTAGALALDFQQTFRAHGLSFAAAILAGYTLTCLWVFANNLAFGSLYQGLDANPHSLGTLMSFVGLRAAQASITLLVFISTWMVTSIHRAHQRAVLMTFAAAVIAQRLPSMVAMIANLTNDPQPWSAVVRAIVPVALQAVYTPLVGLWVIRRERFGDMPASIRFVIVLTIVLTVGSSLLYDLWKVGLISYSLATRLTMDTAEIACATYLTFLLWRRDPRPMRTQSVTGPAGLRAGP